MKKSLGFLFAIFLCFVRQTHAYGPTGHQIVGAIADERLAGTATGKKVGQLLDGLTLEKAAVIADEIKGWDKKGADDPGIFHYAARPRIDEQLRAFWRANPPTEDRMSSIPSHHWFHYTDVPVLNAEKYADGKTGRSEWDGWVPFDELPHTHVALDDALGQGALFCNMLAVRKKLGDQLDT